MFPLAIGVLQVLALDIGTDILPALALGAEPPAKHLLDQPPTVGTCSTGSLFARAFGILGPVEAAVSSWPPSWSRFGRGLATGRAFPDGAALLAASGAAFTAVVLGQVANAFACRSTRRPVWQVGWPTNRLLLGAIATELAMLAASFTSHRSPTYSARPVPAGRASASRCWPSPLLSPPTRSTSESSAPARIHGASR